MGKLAIEVFSATGSKVKQLSYLIIAHNEVKA